MGQELTESDGHVHADLALKTRVKELGARGHFKVISPVMIGAQSKDLVDSRRVLAWKEVDGVKKVKP